MLSNLLETVVQVHDAFKNGNDFALRETANRCIREASGQNDSMKAEIAVVAYALHKLLNKEHIQRDKKWKTIRKIILEELEESIQSLRKQKPEQFNKDLKQITKKIQEADASLGNFIQNLVEKSRVKQASSLYALGLSLGQATELTNADKKALFHYIGYTKLHDEQENKKTMVERVQQLEKTLERTDEPA